MELNKLLREVKIIKSNVSATCEVRSIVNDSRLATTGDLFVAIKGNRRNGCDYIADALKNGAVAIVTEDESVCSNDVPYVLVNSVRFAICKLWSNYYENPGKNILTVAITGTNGKTTSAYFLYNILRSAGIACALISTVECLINDEGTDVSDCSVSDISAAMTTPEPQVLYSLYNKMKKKGVRIAVIEASSHALAQHRLDDLNIEIGAFTNLSREHLDYHISMEDYFFAKKHLFDMCKKSVINTDDAYGKILYNEFSEKSVGFSKNLGVDAQIEVIEKKESGYLYSLTENNSKMIIETRLLGNYNVYNSALAALCAKYLGIGEKYITEGILRTEKVKGRMERYRDKEIYIDYAHTPEAMKMSISALKEIRPEKRLIVLFGCGGNRDKGKRAEMGRVCSSLADFTIITSDNPRDENPHEILCDIVKGITKNKEFSVIPKREEAIEFAVRHMCENEVLLLLGKGHEIYEINSNGKVYFDERDVLDRVFSVD